MKSTPKKQSHSIFQPTSARSNSTAGGDDSIADLNEFDSLMNAISQSERDLELESVTSTMTSHRSSNTPAALFPPSPTLLTSPTVQKTSAHSTSQRIAASKPSELSPRAESVLSTSSQNQKVTSFNANANSSRKPALGSTFTSKPSKHSLPQYPALSASVTLPVLLWPYQLAVLAPPFG